MNRKAFRKIFLPSVIFLFSVLVSGQSAWACDEPAGECYVQLDIKWVDVDLDRGLINIWGEHFDNGGPPIVTLAGYPLDVISGLSNAEWIVAKLLRVPEDIAYGQYRLRVSTGHGHKCKDKYSVKIHPAPPKPSCEPCPPTCECPTVCKGDKGDPGPQGPPGPPGPQGPPGITGWEMRTGEVVTGDTVLDNIIEASVVCTGTKKLLGGGYFCSADYRIFKSSPLQGGDGWQVTAIYSKTFTENPSCQAFAICADIN